MGSQKNIQWFYEELPKLTSRGFLSEEQAKALRAYYGPVKDKNFSSLALSIFSIIGALCIGLGIILLFAFNWSEFSRLQKILLSFIPLLGSWIFLFKALKASSASTALREGAGLFNTLSLGAAIALVSQAFHLPGDLEAFLFYWMLLSWPIFYLMNSSVVCVLYLAGITWWSAAAQNGGGHSLYFWPMVLLAVPFLKKRFEYAESELSLGKLWLLRAVFICLSVSLGVSLEKVIPGLWIVIYSSYFTVVFLGSLLYAEKLGEMSHELCKYGLLGIVGLSYLLTYRGWWKEIGWNYYRSTGRFHEMAAWIDYFFLGVLFSFCCILLVQLLKTLKLKNARCFEVIVFSLLPFFAAIFFVLQLFEIPELIPTLFFNGYLFSLGIIALRAGIRAVKMSWLNGGLLILALLIWSRFADASLGILGRAFVFIVLGFCFLIANKVLAKKLEAQNEA